MVHEKMQQLMNEQIKNEFYSAYLYLSVAAYFHRKGLDGMAQWMRVQAMEEQVHAMKFFDHIRDRDGMIQLLPLDQPQAEWPSPLDAWKAAYDHEKLITGKINSMVKLANEVGDYAAMPLLNWFVDEQIEEEAQTLKAVQEIELIGGKGDGLLMLDREMGARIFTMPAKNEKGA
jgi:ferritin